MVERIGCGWACMLFRPWRLHAVLSVPSVPVILVHLRIVPVHPRSFVCVASIGLGAAIASYVISSLFGAAFA
jgi:hypothetical protein